MGGVVFLDRAEEVPAATGDQSAPHASATAGLPRPSVSDVLGRPVRTENHSKLRATVDPLLGRIRSSVQAVFRPHVLGVLVTGLGILILLLLGYIYLFTPLSADRSQHGLLQQITSDPARTFNLAEGKLPPEGSPVAVLEIPSLHFYDAVVQGSDAQDLRSGPGHMPTTALPGQRGNAVIAGRRATFGAPFGAIGSLKKGQLVIVVDGYGTYHYKVTRVVNAEGGRHDVVTETKANRLTLVTAASGFFPRGRLAVIATLMGKPLADATEPHFHAPSTELGLADDPASGFLAIVWCLVFFVLLSVAAWLLRRVDQPVVVYLLAVPVLLLVGLFACESIIGFLPATV